MPPPRLRQIGNRDWFVAYEVDFSTLTPADLKAGGDGNKTIGGLTWSLGNSATASAIALVGGVGLRIALNTTPSNYSGSADNAPRLSIALASLVGSYSIMRTRQILQAEFGGNADASTEAAGVFYSRSNRQYELGVGIGNDGVNAELQQWRNNNDAITSATTDQTGTVAALERAGHEANFLYGSLVSSALPRPSAMTEATAMAGLSLAANAVPLFVAGTDLVLLRAWANNATGSHVAVIKKLRIYHLAISERP